VKRSFDTLQATKVPKIYPHPDHDVVALAATSSYSAYPSALERFSGVPPPAESLPGGRGSESRPARQRMTSVCRGFFVARIDEVPMNRVRRRPRVIAKRRAYQRCNPRCTRVLRGQATRKCLFAGISAKPSDGLEPSTPSLPSRSRAGTAGKAGKPRARKAGQEEGIGRRRVAAGGRSCPECCSVSVPSTKLAGDRIRRACRRVNAAAVRGRRRDKPPSSPTWSRC
jgi:hypothetical protein